ncbi:unnamed protein product [Rangifer tarandus platyrhynchus]|uniref:Uncharacterized protein n=1 Tax=Rangifer tarandus platyrhynchus TaxID=3082113 RepID=A0AC59Y6G4_RANTA
MLLPSANSAQEQWRAYFTGLGRPGHRQRASGAQGCSLARGNSEQRGPHLPSAAPPPPALSRQTSRQDVPAGRLSRTEPRPLPRPRG